MTINAIKLLVAIVTFFVVAANKIVETDDRDTIKLKYRGKTTTRTTTEAMLKPKWNDYNAPHNLSVSDMKRILNFVAQYTKLEYCPFEDGAEECENVNALKSSVNQIIANVMRETELKRIAEERKRKTEKGECLTEGGFLKPRKSSKKKKQNHRPANKVGKHALRSAVEIIRALLKFESLPRDK